MIRNKSCQAGRHSPSQENNLAKRLLPGVSVFLPLHRTFTALFTCRTGMPVPTINPVHLRFPIDPIQYSICGQGIIDLSSYDWIPIKHRGLSSEIWIILTPWHTLIEKSRMFLVGLLFDLNNPPSYFRSPRYFLSLWIPSWLWHIKRSSDMTADVQHAPTCQQYSHHRK